jgi:hypothetical protein
LSTINQYDEGCQARNNLLRGGRGPTCDSIQRDTNLTRTPEKTRISIIRRPTTTAQVDGSLSNDKSRRQGPSITTGGALESTRACSEGTQKVDSICARSSAGNGRNHRTLIAIDLVSTICQSKTAPHGADTVFRCATRACRILDDRTTRNILECFDLDGALVIAESKCTSLVLY